MRLSAARVVVASDLFEIGRGFQTEFTRNPGTNLFGSPAAAPAILSSIRSAPHSSMSSWEYYFGAQGLL